jgi:AraC-like DNA-binding protein
MNEDEGAAALDAYFEILSACIGCSTPSAPRAMELRQRIHRYIDAHLSESTLGPGEVASAVGISVRHVHRLFLMTGNTLGDYIRTRRLKGCRGDLANPSMRTRTITEIAFFWGFSDSAHFSHSFRKQFGVSPRAFRVRAATEASWREEDSPRDLLQTETPEVACPKPN